MYKEIFPSYVSSWGSRDQYKFFIICIFCMVVPSLIRSLVYTGDEQERAKFISQCISYLFLIVLCIKYGRMSAVDLSAMFTFPKVLDCFVAFGLGLALFGFVLGENALEVWIVSGLNKTFAYSLWPFHEISSVKETSPSVFLLLMAVFIAPCVEEFYFRGVLFPALSKSKKLIIAMLIDSLFFVILHISNLHFIGTVVFSLILCGIYFWTRSVLLCIIVHSAFNVAALGFENYGYEFLTRSLGQISSAMEWSTLFLMFFLSSLSIGLVAINRKRFMPC